MLFSVSRQKPIARSSCASSVVKPPIANVNRRPPNSKTSRFSDGYACQRWLFSRLRALGVKGRKAQQVTCSASPWEALGVDPQADEQQIRRAYRKLALKHHPDTNSSPEAHRTFVDIHEAYEVLMGRRRGKEDAERPRAKGGWDFHDWYWNFMTAQRQKSKSGAATRPTTALRTENLESQLHGLKRQAAARRMRAQSQPSPSSWSNPVEEQPATAAPTAAWEPLTATNMHEPHESAASMPAAAQAPLREEAGPEAMGGASPHNGVNSEQLQPAEVGQPIDRPLHTGHVLHCVQELLNHAWRSNAVTFTVNSWPAQGSTDFSPQASTAPQAAPSQARQGVAATVERPLAQTLARETTNASGTGQGDVVTDKHGNREGFQRGEGEPCQQGGTAVEFTAPPEVQSQLAGLKRRAALRVQANV